MNDHSETKTHLDKRIQQTGKGNDAPTVIRGRIGLFLGPSLLIAMLLLPAPEGMRIEAWRTAAVGLLMAIWWVTEAIPIPATALLPLALFPLLGVMPVARTALPYANPVIFLFMGGFIIAAAFERSGLHRRLALSIIKLVGTRPRHLVGGFMAATAFLSMWVSNTATVVMMLPMALSVVTLIGKEERENEPAEPNLGVALLLGIAYAASIGGIATLIGTPPNALLAGFMEESFGVSIGFAEWMLLGVPLMLMALPLCWLLLVYVLYPVGQNKAEGSGEMIERELAKLGTITRSELTVGLITLMVACVWIFQPLLEDMVPGLSDAGIAIAGALLIFLVPIRWHGMKRAINWSDAERLPWGVLVLFGGGLTLAGAIQETGLAGWIGGHMQGLETMSLLVIVLIVTTVIVFLTELTSNTATAASFMPVVASLAVSIGADPLLLTIPVALGASCAFMMPVATPPNAIVYGSGRVSIPQMVKAGVWLNLLLIALITLAVLVLGPVIFDK